MGGGLLFRGVGITSVVERNLFSSNTCGKGGGMMALLYDGGKVINNTFYNNVADSTYGGGLHMSNAPTVPMDVINNTFVGNSALMGGGIGCVGCAARLANNILTGNVGNNCFYFGGGTVFQSLGGNIDSVNTCGFGGSDLVNTDPLVVAGAPQANGGYSLSILLQMGSPAIGYGVPSSCPVVDQRGTVRPGNCSSGATQ